MIMKDMNYRIFKEVLEEEYLAFVLNNIFKISTGYCSSGNKNREVTCNFVELKKPKIFLSHLNFTLIK